MCPSKQPIQEPSEREFMKDLHSITVMNQVVKLIRLRTSLSTDDEGDLNVISVFDVLAAAHESEEVEVLLPHKLCGNHTLNLVASTDNLQARSDKSYKRTFDRAMAKVQALSNAVNRSPKLNDLVEEITETTFTNPTSTRWSSSFHAVQH